MKNIVVFAAVIIFALTVTAALGASEAETFTVTPATDLPDATGGTAVTVEAGETLEMEIPIEAGTQAIEITARPLEEGPLNVEVLLEGEISTHHYLPAGVWGGIRIGVMSRDVGDTVQMQLTPDGPMAVDTVEVSEIEPSHETLPLTSAGRIVRETPLVADGQAAAVILEPAEEDYRQVAADFGTRFEEKTGVSLPTIPEDGVTEEQLRAQTCIVLGNLATGPVALRLYARHLIYSDGYYPGPGGHELRTVHDPWGGGVNVVFMGGSDPAGVQSAANALNDRIEPAENITLPVIVDWSSEHTNFGGLTEEQIAERATDLREYLHSFRRSNQYMSASNRPASVAQAYYLSGDPSYARAYEAMVDELATYYSEHEVEPPTFALSNIVVALDQIEECPEFSDDARLKAADWVRQIVDDSFHFWELRGPISREEAGVIEPAWNHETHPASGVAYAVEYFDSHFNMEPVQWWRDVITTLFTGQETSYKPLEDSANYQWITLYHTMQWALITGDMDIFTTDTLKKTAELAIACHDNFGDEATFGDAWMPFGSNARQIFRGASLYYADPRYQWMLERLEEDRGHYPGGMYWDSPTQEPTDHIGLKTFILDPAVHAKQSAGKVPAEAALDKAVFRSGFDPQDDYLMLDGMSAGIHGHYDANGIIRFTDNGRLWLADMDYIRAWPKWHNSINISRDGQTTEVPPLAELTAKGAFDGFGMVQSRVPGYAGTDWTRSIFWQADEFFLVMDELSANEPGYFRSDCLWRTLGEVSLEGSRLDVQQEGEYFHIHNADGSRPMLRTHWDRGHGGDRGYYAEYPHAGKITKILHQNKEANLEAGDALHYINAFHTSGQAEPAYAVRRLTEAAVVDGPETSMLVGIGPWTHDGASIDAAMFALSDQSALLVDVVSIDVPGIEIAFETPLDMDINLATTTVTLSEGELPPDAEIEPAVYAEWLEAVIDSAQTPPEPEELQPLEVAEAVQADWRVDLGSEIECTAISPDGEYIAAGTNAGETVVLDAKGEIIFRQPADAMVRAVAFADLDGDGTPEIVSGADDAKLRAYDLGGGRVAAVEIQPYHGRSGSVSSVAPADVDTDGDDEIIVGSDNWHHYCFDGNGSEFWRTGTTHASTVSDTGDLDGDGEEEVLAGTEYYSAKILDSDGGSLGAVRGGPNWTAAAAIDVTGDGTSEATFGSDDAIVHVVDGEGTAVWSHNIGGTVTGIAPLGGGIAATSEAGYCWIFDSAGEVIATVRLPEQATDVAPVGNFAAVACDDGSIYILDADGAIVAAQSGQGRPENLSSIAGSLIAARGSTLLCIRP